MNANEPEHVPYHEDQRDTERRLAPVCDYLRRCHETTGCIETLVGRVTDQFGPVLSPATEPKSADRDRPKALEDPVSGVAAELRELDNRLTQITMNLDGILNRAEI